MSDEWSERVEALTKENEKLKARCAAVERQFEDWCHRALRAEGQVEILRELLDEAL